MRERDLREFMSSVGLVRDVRVIADPRTRKCKGVAYVEFKSPESVALAIGLTGQKLLGIPIQVRIWCFGVACGRGLRIFSIYEVYLSLMPEHALR